MKAEFAKYRPMGLAVLLLSLTPVLRAQTNVMPGAAPQAGAAAPAEAGQPQAAEAVPEDYRVGREDLLEISVLEAPELNRTVRVSTKGEISVPPLGAAKVAGLTSQEIETLLADLLRQNVLQDPHVSVFVREIESHPVSVAGAVKKPGVFRIRGPKPLLEVLAMAEGLADDAGDTVLVMRGTGFSDVTGRKTEAEAVGGPQSTASSAQTQATTASDTDTATEVGVKDLMNSGDSRFNVMVYPGDIVKVNRAGIVYVLGDVKKPGGFVLRNSEAISVLQALAMAEGFAPTAAKSQARIIRTSEESGERKEIPLDLGKVMAGKSEDPMLQTKDIVFIPKSGGKMAIFRTAEMIMSTVPGALIYRGF